MATDKNPKPLLDLKELAEFWDGENSSHERFIVKGSGIMTELEDTGEETEDGCKIYRGTIKPHSQLTDEERARYGISDDSKKEA